MPSPLLLPDPAADETDRLLSELENRIHKEYKQAIKEADKKWSDYLSAFEAQDKVEAERLAKGEITKAEYQDWRRRHLAQGKHWEEMRNVMAQDYHNRNLIAAKLADNSMADVYAVNANYGTYMIEHSGKFDTGFTLYNHDSAEALLKEEWAINPETGRNSFLPPPKPGGKRARELEGLRTTNPDLLWNAKNIQSAMMQGVLSGESMTSLARRLAGVAEMDERQAIRNARTLTTNVQNKGRMDAGDRIKKLGGEMVDEWSAILDGRTRHSHRHMHGERKDHDSEEPFSNGCRWPGDPFGPPAEVYNCRCRVKLWSKGFEGETIKHSDAMGDMSFEEWQGYRAMSSNGEIADKPTPGEKITPNELDRFAGEVQSRGYRFAKSVRGISKPVYGGFENYSGDVEELYRILDEFDASRKIWPIRLQQKGLLIGYESLGNYDDFARTAGRTILFNKDIYDDSAFLTRRYASAVKSGNFVKGTTPASVPWHELGHVFQNVNSRLYGRLEKAIGKADFREKALMLTSKYGITVTPDETYPELLSELLSATRSTDKRKQRGAANLLKEVLE